MKFLIVALVLLAVVGVLVPTITADPAEAHGSEGYRGSYVCRHPWGQGGWYYIYHNTHGGNYIDVMLQFNWWGGRWRHIACGFHFGP